MEQEKQPAVMVSGEMGGALAAQLLNMLGSLQAEVTDHMKGEEERIHELRSSIAILTEKVNQFMLAFPGKDFRAHCEYHQLLIDAARDKSAFWKTMRYDLVRLGLLGFALWALYAMWRQFLLGPK